MHTYARIDNGVVVEIIEPMTYDVASPPGCEYNYEAGDEVPIAQRFVPSFVVSLIDVTNFIPQPKSGWTATQNGETWDFQAPHSV